MSDLPRRADNKERYIFVDRRVDPSSKEGMMALFMLTP
jgi:hypothetical protein